MAKIGSEAPIGSNAKMGAKAWGTVTEESGTVLFDGVVTLSEIPGGAGFGGQIELTAMPVLGNAYTITINGHSFTGIAEDDDGDIAILAQDGESGAALAVYEGGASFNCSADVGQAGENTLFIQEVTFGVFPNSVTAGVGQGTPLTVVGSVASYESSDTSVAIVVEHDGEYGIRGVANGTCTVTFVSTSGAIATVNVTVGTID